MTTRLDYADATLTDFDATVLDCQPTAGGFSVVLDRTAFYPASGGQPADRGRLGEVEVLDVSVDDAGVVRHLTRSARAAGATVRGTIDWPRRFDHMQQHTGQHILSAAFDRRLGVRTTSFHLGADLSTIDLAREVTPDEMAAAEADANAIVWDDRPVSVRFVSAAEAAALPLRKESARTGELRLVEVTGFDLSACGGTHVSSAGQIGIVAVTGWERFKGATRLGFACGARALRSHAALRDVMAGVTRALSMSSADVVEGVRRLQQDAKAAGRTIERLDAELAGYRAEALRAEIETIGPWRGVLREQPAADAAALRRLAAAVVSAPGLVVVLAGGGTPTPVVAARSADVAFDAARWVGELTAEFGGRGGGRQDLAQCGVPADPSRVLAFARRTMI
jgi:alanyl-tRNA synthetase